MKTIAILGSTGSVGAQTLQVLQRNPNRYTVKLLVAGSNWRLMEEQVRIFKPRWVVMADEPAAKQLKLSVADLEVAVFSGSEAIVELLRAEKFDLVVAAMVGYAGLAPVVAAIESGANLALANKETLVMAGRLITSLCRQTGADLLPLDSEHSAIFQCLQGNAKQDVSRLILTASGGPFLGKSLEQLTAVTPVQALKHPNWQMGAKISIDSATLMNKGLEIIEASWLFQVPEEKIKVLIHPQSIVHSLVEFVDGAVLAQLGVPSMETPIQLALSWPQRWPGPAHCYLDLATAPPLEFSLPDTRAFPCLELARSAFRQGGSAPAVLSTANEVCVDSFLQGKLAFNKIPFVIGEMLASVPWHGEPGLTAIIETAETTMLMTKKFIDNLG